MVFPIKKVGKYIMANIITDLGEKQAEHYNKTNKNDNAPKRKAFNK